MARTLEAIVEPTRPVPAPQERLLPVASALEGLLPEGGLRRGSTVAVSGSTSLALTLLAGPSAAGSWCAVVGARSLGVTAAAEAGVDLARLVLVPVPGPQWAAVVAALLDAFDVVAVRPPDRVRSADLRRLTARARERRSVLLALDRWEGAEAHLTVTASRWEGIGQGHGRLLAREVEVVAEGRGALARPRRTRLWLPALDGEVHAAPRPVRAVSRRREAVASADGFLT